MDSNDILGCEGVPQRQREAYEANYRAYRVGISNEECMRIYDEQAKDYEKICVDADFGGPAYAAQTVHKYHGHNTEASVIDVAAGTGLVGEQLMSCGFSNIDALEPSRSMLDQAMKKGIYKKHILTLLAEEKTEIEDDTYDCLVLSGGMGEGHIPCAALTEMIRIVRPGGHVIIVMREEYLSYVKEYVNRLEPMMADLEKGGQWVRVERTRVPNFVFGKDGIIFVFKVLGPRSPSDQRS